MAQCDVCGNEYDKAFQTYNKPSLSYHYHGRRQRGDTP